MILLRILKDNRTTGTTGMVLLLLGLFAKSFVQVTTHGGRAPLTSYTGMPFYNLLFGAIHTVPLLNHIIALMLLLFMGYMLIRISVRNVLLDFRSVMPAVFMFLFTAALPSSQQVSPALTGAVFYLFSFAILFEVHDKRPDTSSVFMASLVLALGSMFYLKLVWFLPLVWISLAIMRTVTWRELFYPVIAYFLLALLLLTWYWGILDNFSELATLIRSNLAFTRGFIPHHYSINIYYGFLLLLVFIASLYMFNHFPTRKTVIQNIYQVMFFMFLAGILFFVLIARFDPATLVFIAIPVSYLLSNYFHRRKNPWTHELVLWVVIVLLVYMQWMA